VAAGCRLARLTRRTLTHPAFRRVALLIVVIPGVVVPGLAARG
jgi:hypothetical protein